MFTLPLPIELQFLIFKYEHAFNYKSTLNAIQTVCCVCKCVINQTESSPCFGVYVGNLLVVTYHKHWLQKELDCIKYDQDIIKKVCNTLNINSVISFHEVKIKFIKSNKIKIIRHIDII